MKFLINEIGFKVVMIRVRVFIIFSLISQSFQKLKANFVCLFFVRQFQTKKVKTIFKSNAQSRSKLSMIRLRWLKDEENYILQVKVKKWKQKANNREGWASLMKNDKIILLFRRLLIALKCNSVLCLRNNWKMQNRRPGAGATRNKWKYPCTETHIL
jgi:hypothetical protein